MKFSKSAYALCTSGSFVDEGVEPHDYGDSPTHPVLRVLRASAEERKNLYIFSPQVESIIMINNGRVVTANVPQIGYDESVDPTFTKPLVVCAMGSQCQTTTPVTFSVRDLQTDLLYIGSDFAGLEAFISGDELPTAAFTDSRSPLEGAVTRPAEGLIRAFRFPKCLPKALGIPIIEGSIFSDEVIQSLEDYHPVAKTWALLHKALNNRPNCRIERTTLMRLEARCFPMAEHDLEISYFYETLVHPLAPSQLRTELECRIDAVIARNKTLFEKENPGFQPEPDDLVNLSQPGRNHAVTTVDEPKTHIETEEELLHKKYFRFISSWRLLLAIKNSEGKIIIPDLSKQFLQCFLGSSKSENVRTYKGYVKDWMRDRANDNRDFFLKRISKLLLNHATITMLLQCTFHLSSLDDDISELDHSISMLNFLPVSQDSADYKAFISTTRGEELDDVMEECAEKKTKKSTKTFCKGLQNSTSHILTALANLDAILAFATEADGKPEHETPILVNFIRKLADIIDSRNFHNFEEKFLKECPWIPHNTLCIAQNILGEAAAIADSTRNINALRDGVPLPPNTFDKLYMIYDGNVKGITLCCTLSQPGIFQIPARSYKPPKPVSQVGKRKGFRDASDYSEYSTAHRKGWFISQGKFSWPKGLSVRVCNKFAQQGMSCRNPNCMFDHKVFPRDFNEQDKKRIIQFEKECANFSFAPFLAYKLKASSSSSSNEENQDNSPSQQESKKAKKDSDTSAVTVVKTESVDRK